MALTFIALGVILLASVTVGTFVYLTKYPPKVYINITLPKVDLDVSKLIPTPLLVQMQAVAPVIEASTSKGPIPLNVFQYIGMESEEHARVSRLEYARKLYGELQNWDAVLATLKAEDESGRD